MLLAKKIKYHAGMQACEEEEDSFVHKTRRRHCNFSSVLYKKTIFKNYFP